MAHPLFTPIEDALILKMREEQGCSWIDIARALGRPSGWCISFRYSRVLRPAKKAAPGPEARERPCMRCRTVFRSPSFGVRHCDPCRAQLRADDGGAPEFVRVSRRFGAEDLEPVRA